MKYLNPELSKRAYKHLKNIDENDLRAFYTTPDGKFIDSPKVYTIDKNGDFIVYASLFDEEYSAIPAVCIGDVVAQIKTNIEANELIFKLSYVKEYWEALVTDGVETTKSFRHLDLGEVLVSLLEVV